MRHLDGRGNRQPAQLVQLELRVARRNARLARAAVQREGARLDDAHLQHRRDTRRLALHEHREQILKVLRHFPRRLRTLLRREELVAERPRPHRECRAELLQPELREFDLPVCDGLSQIDAPRKLERLRQRHRPHRPVADLIPSEIMHTLIAEFRAEFRVRPFARSHAPSFRGGDFRLVKFQLGILRDSLGDERVERRGLRGHETGRAKNGRKQREAAGLVFDVNGLENFHGLESRLLNVE